MEKSIINEFIDSGKFKDWLISEIVLSKKFLEEQKPVETGKKVRNIKSPGESKIENYFTETPWGRLISDPNVRLISSNLGKIFRRRFRVPFVIFEYLVKLTRDYNLFDYKMHHKTLIPKELSILCILRIMGRGECFDTIEELSGIYIFDNYSRIFFHLDENFYCSLKE